MSNRKAKTTDKQVEQTAPAVTPEAVEEQAVQAVSEPVPEAAAQPAVPAEPQEGPAPEPPERPQTVVSAPQGLNLREGPHVSYAAITVLPDSTPAEILDLPEDVEVPNWALVKTCAGIGWVNTDFLRKVEP